MLALFFRPIGAIVDIEKYHIMKNAPTRVAIGGVDTAENEPLKVYGYGVSTPPPPVMGQRSWVMGQPISTAQVQQDD